MQMILSLSLIAIAHSEVAKCLVPSNAFRREENNTVGIAQSEHFEETWFEFRILEIY